MTAGHGILIVTALLVACSQDPGNRLIEIHGSAFSDPPIQVAPIVTMPGDCVIRASLTVECWSWTSPDYPLIVCVDVLDVNQAVFPDWNTPYDSMCSEYVTCSDADAPARQLAVTEVTGHTMAGVGRFVSIVTNNWGVDDNKDSFRIWGAEVEISDGCP